jgi:replicative DNA helicase
MKVDPDTPIKEAPSNMEAEQALLGAIMVNNEALNHVGDTLRPEDFYATIHQHIYKAILELHDRGQVASPVTLKSKFPEDLAYLIKLASGATSIINVHAYSQLIRDCSVRRQLVALCEGGSAEAYGNNELPALQQIEAIEHQLFQLANEGQAEQRSVSVGDSFESVLRNAESAYKRSGEVIGLDTGFSEINRVLGGLHSSDLLILAGRPAMGKTALGMNIAFNAAQKMAIEDAGKDKPRCVGVFSLEMSKDQLSMRLLSGHSGIPSHAIQNGSMNRAQFDTLIETKNLLKSLPIRIDDSAALPINAIRSRARRLKRTHNLSLLIVDYLQLVRAGGNNSQRNRVQEISEISQGLKAIAKELDIPVIALSQLSRALESRDDKRPVLSDLRESGSIEQDADIVMFVYRDEYYIQSREPRPEAAHYNSWLAQMESARGMAEVIIAKHRNGPTANVKLRFTGHLSKFSEDTPETYLLAQG